MTRAVVVGSGPNGLAAALTLADAGVDVTVLEATAEAGGGTRSRISEATGLLHDECSGFHPLVLDNVFTRTFDLGAHGLDFAHPPIQYSHPLDDGLGGAAHRSIEETADGLGADARAWRGVFGPLTAQFDRIGEEFLQPVLHVPRHPIALARFGLRAAPPAALLARRFRTPEARALFGGVAAHAFRSFSGLLSSAIGVALGAAAHRHGWPVAVGGSGAISAAMISALRKRGGRVETGVHITRLEELDEPDLVLLDTSPWAATEILGDRQPGRIAAAYRRYRHGPGAFQIALAVEGGIPWIHPPSREAGTVHVGGTFEETAAAEAAVWKGHLPDDLFVLVGQQYLADPARRSGDLVPIDAYAHVPAHHRGDITEAILDRIERYAPGFRGRIRDLEVRSTRAIAAHNPNFVGGDIVTGANTARQLVFRPRPALDPYATGVPGVYLCSAATPPGAGAHGLCGWHAARSALRSVEA